MLRWAAILLWLVALVAAPGCGDGGNFDVCHAACGAKGRCGTAADEVAGCHLACDAKPGCYSDQDNEENRMCTNAPELRAQKLACYSRACGEIDTCVQPLVAINQQNPLCLRSSP